MPRRVQRYVTELLVEILGPAEIEKRFEWCRGDSLQAGCRGRTLPFDAVWDSRKLIVEVDERQHGEAVDHFDKPWKLTVSGVHRGEQRRLYDQRKGRHARRRGYKLIRLRVSILASKGRRIAHRDHDADRTAILELLREKGVQSGPLRKPPTRR